MGCTTSLVIGVRTYSSMSRYIFNGLTASEIMYLIY